MSDIVERLRGFAHIAHAAAPWGCAGEGYVMEKAADRIEELQARVEELSLALDYFLSRDPDKSSSWEYTRDRAEELARAVLGEKEAPGQDVDG